MPTTAAEVIVHTAVLPAPTLVGDQLDGGMVGRSAASEAGSNVIVLPSTGDTGTISNLTFGGNFIRLLGA